MSSSHSKLPRHVARTAPASSSPPSAVEVGQSPTGRATPQQKGKAWYNRTCGSQPPATSSKATEGACRTFVPAKRFDGSRKGYVFKDGPKGLGFYVDVKPVHNSVFACSTFVPAKRFDGSRKGYVFKDGPKGLGYYVDVKPVHNSAPPPAGSVVNKAWKFVEKVLEMVGEMRKVEGSMVQAVASDSMFYVAQRMLSAQQVFAMAGKPTAVDLGYHYTQKENMVTIRSDGLMSSQERATKGVSAVNYHGALYGQGVYTATNPCAWHGYYGDVGLIVARLRGANVDFDPASQNAGNHDSVTVERDNVRECIVLATSQQCIPILQFDSSQISRNSHVHPGNMMVNRYHVALQALIDEIFNMI
jgi:hypothetical protein